MLICCAVGLTWLAYEACCKEKDGGSYAHVPQPEPAAGTAQPSSSGGKDGKPSPKSATDELI